jgi:hypothetical protein
MHLAPSWTEQVERRTLAFRRSENLVSAVRSAMLRGVNASSFARFILARTQYSHISDVFPGLSASEQDVTMMRANMPSLFVAFTSVLALDSVSPVI